jgi:hypothetical protein
MVRRSRPWTILTVVIVVVTALVFCMQSLLLPIMPECQFHRLTGWHCTGCGARRAIMLMARGEWGLALRMNALLLLGGLAGLALLLRQVLREWRGGGTMFLWRRRHTVLLVSLFLGFGILRNIPVAPFTWLAPVPLR